MKLFLKIFDKLSPHRAWVYGGMCLLLLLCGISAYHMKHNEDIAAFMPLDQETAKYSAVFNNLGGQNTIAVTFKAQDNARDEDKLLSIETGIEAFGKSVARRDTGHWVKNLRLKVDETAMLKVLQTVWQTYPLLLTDSDYLRLDSLVTGSAHLQSQMEQDKLMLMLPTGGFMTQSLPYDPLHLSSGITHRLRDLSMDGAYQAIDGYLFKDSVGIVLLDSPFGISDSHHNQELQHLLDDCVADVKSVCPSLTVSTVGAPLIAATNAAQIKAGSILAISLSVVLIFLILLYSFRRISDLIWIGISVFVGWLFALGIIALMRDGISLIVIGIGSVIIGIAVNYPLHFIDHLKPETNMREALKEMIPPLLVGNITTVSAFLCLVLLDAQAMRDLGLFGSLMLIGTILFVLIGLPVFLKPQQREEIHRYGLSLGKLGIALHHKRIRRVIWWGVVGLTLVFGYFSTGTSFDSNMQHH
ncbi:MAG: hypothetical protein LUC45_01280 [Paraprevotella sp.]|nr:hypothetical protein [Paraprevotella sp.]